MATTENNGLMTYLDGSGNKHLLYPITKGQNVVGAVEDADKFGGRPPEAYYAVNLFGNSDFKIAQAGYNAAHGSVYYLCDRWIATTSGTKVSNGVKFTNSGGIVYQRVSDIAGKTLTFAMKTDGTGEQQMSVYTADLGSMIRQIRGYKNSDGIVCGTATIPSDIDVASFVLYPENGSIIEWAALYEGTYTAETLPPFVPRPYAVELADCKRYFYRIKGMPYAIVGTGMVRTTTATIMFVPLPPMRDLPESTPTVSSNGAFNITTAAGAGAVQSLAIDSWANSSQGVMLNITHTAISAAGQAAVMQFSNDGSAYIDFNRDL